MFVLAGTIGFGAKPPAQTPTLEFNMIVPAKVDAPSPSPDSKWMIEELARDKSSPHFSTAPCTLSAGSPRVRVSVRKNWCCDSLLFEFGAYQGPRLFRKVIQVPADSLFTKTITLVDSSGRKPIPGLYVLEIYHFTSGRADGRAIVIRP